MPHNPHCISSFSTQHVLLESQENSSSACVSFFGLSPSWWFDKPGSSRPVQSFLSPEANLLTVPTSWCLSLSDTILSDLFFLAMTRKSISTLPFMALPYNTVQKCYGMDFTMKAMMDTKQRLDDCSFSSFFGNNYKLMDLY